MDIGKAFGQMFKDPQWVKKMLFYALFCFLCVFLIGIPFVLGYTILILNNYLQGKDILPEWEGNWEKILITGLKVIFFSILFGIVSSMLSFFTTGLLRVIEQILLESDGLEIIGALVTLIRIGVSFFVSVIISLTGYTAQIQFAKNLSFSDVFDFDWYVSFLKKSWKNLIIVWLLTLLTGIIAAAGFFALCIGVFFTVFYAITVNQALLAEVARVAGETATSGNDIAPTQQSAPTALLTPSAPVKVENTSSVEEPVEMEK